MQGDSFCWWIFGSFPVGTIKSELDIHPLFLLLWIYWFPDPRGETAESQVRRLFNLEKCARWGGRLSSSHRRLPGLIAPHLLSVLPISSTSVIVVGGKYYLVALICVPRMMTNDMSSFCVLYWPFGRLLLWCVCSSTRRGVTYLWDVGIDYLQIYGCFFLYHH